MTRRAELAPITELNCPTRPHANTDVEVRAEGVKIEDAETPPLLEVDQMTRPRPVRGRTTDFRVKRWRLKTTS